MAVQYRTYEQGEQPCLPGVHSTDESDAIDDAFQPATRLILTHRKQRYLLQRKLKIGQSSGPGYGHAGKSGKLSGPNVGSKVR